MDSEMEGFELESPPSPPTSYLSMESEEDQPVGADKEHDFAPLIVDLERAASPETKRSKSECCSVQPREGAFFPGNGVNLERAASPETKQSESVQPREGAFFPGQGPEATHQSFSSSENMMLELERMIPEKKKNLCPMGIPFIFKSILKTLQELKKSELSQFKKLMRRTYPQYFENQMEDFDVLDVVDMIMERCGKVIAIKVTVHILKCMKMNDLATSLAVETRRIMLQHELKERLKMKNRSYGFHRLS
ncbi:hypothetical protein COCON_G00189070 [Conger conger]|uniref:Pyrin domain-containing protein n=1 Tax=Conger conger TaxID=82655 RepID=A0A9Q1D392_CONCO|nr:hypothetical protein COCON_G00189070 [Conger conger]